MLVSVIIPCKNSEHFIRETIDSALMQTYKEIEIICVDNGSTDKTEEIINSIIENNPNVQLLKEPRKGANFARNKGLEASRGEFIQFIDSDDVILPEKLSSQVSEIMKGYDIIVSDRKVFDLKMQLCLKELTFPEVQQNPLECSIVKIIGNGNPIYTRKSLMDIGGWREDLTSSQDWELHIRLSLRGKKFGYLPGYFFYSRTRSDSLSSDWQKVNLNAIKVLDDYRMDIVKTDSINKFDVQKKIFHCYFQAALYTGKTDEILKKIRLWNLYPNYRKYLNFNNKFISYFFGLKGIIRIKRIISSNQK